MLAHNLLTQIGGPNTRAAIPATSSLITNVGDYAKNGESTPTLGPKPEAADEGHTAPIPSSSTLLQNASSTGAKPSFSSVLAGFLSNKGMTSTSQGQSDRTSFNSQK